jgi:hypothetical protein
MDEYNLVTRDYIIVAAISIFESIIFFGLYKDIDFSTSREYFRYAHDGGTIAFWIARIIGTLVGYILYLFMTGAILFLSAAGFVARALNRRETLKAFWRILEGRFVIGDGGAVTPVETFVQAVEVEENRSP